MLEQAIATRSGITGRRCAPGRANCCFRLHHGRRAKIQQPRSVEGHRFRAAGALARRANDPGHAPGQCRIVLAVRRGHRRDDRASRSRPGAQPELRPRLASSAVTLRQWAGRPESAIEHAETALRLSPRDAFGRCFSSRSASRLFLRSAFRRSGAEAAPQRSRTIRAIPSHIAHARRLLCPYGAARRSTRDQSTRLRGHRALRSSCRLRSCPIANPEDRELLLVGPAPGDGRGRHERDPPSRRDPRRRCGGVFAADGGGRGRHARTPQSAAPRAPRSENRRAQGRIVKTTGDGLLVEFASVVDAVRCAVAVQQAMPERNTGVAADSRIELRIGINLGDVIVEGDDLYGDGVNIAARLEAWPNRRHLHLSHGA